MSKLAIFQQAMELYSLGMEVEKEKRYLEDFIKKHGATSPRTIKQSKKIDTLLNRFTALEQKHIAETESHINAGQALPFNQRLFS